MWVVWVRLPHASAKLLNQHVLTVIYGSNRNHGSDCHSFPRFTLGFIDHLRVNRDGCPNVGMAHLRFQHGHWCGVFYQLRRQPVSKCVQTNVLFWELKTKLSASGCRSASQSFSAAVSLNRASPFTQRSVCVESREPLNRAM